MITKIEAAGESVIVTGSNPAAGAGRTFPPRHPRWYNRRQRNLIRVDRMRPSHSRGGRPWLELSSTIPHLNRERRPAPLGRFRPFGR